MTKKATVRNCERCGNRHEGLFIETFKQARSEELFIKKFKQARAEIRDVPKYYMICPETMQPILLYTKSISEMLSGKNVLDIVN